MSNFTLQDAIDLATFAHRHQYDKAGMPYIQHPLRVLESVKAIGAQPYVQMAAVLHDVTEETPFTAAMLVALGVPEAAVNIVSLVDRDYSLFMARHFSIVTDRDEESGRVTVPGKHDSRYADYYYSEIRKNPGALIVKKADIGDNLQPWRLEYLPVETQGRLRKKYAKALEQLS